MSAYASLPRFFNHSKSAVEHRWHHFLPSGTIWLQRLLLILLLTLPAYLLLIFSQRSLRASSPVIFLRLHRHPQTALAVWLCVHLPPSFLHFLPNTFTACLSPGVPLPPSLLSFFHPRLCVRRWQLRSSGALRGAEKTKIWFSDSDLDFLQIGWKIRRSFYSYTTQSLPLQLHKPWLQTTGVAAISTNMPSVTRRLCVFYLKPRLVGEHNVLNIGPRETGTKCRMGRRVKQKAQSNAHKPEVNTAQQERRNESILTERLWVQGPEETQQSDFYESSCSFGFCKLW